jgi:transcriptional regulator GlxA family with amidase domain
VIILDWESSAEHPASPSADVGAVSRADLCKLREHVSNLHSRPAEAWVEELACRLRSLGLDVAPERHDREPHVAPPDLVRLYRALGTVLSRLHEHPSLEELALSVGFGERQVKRKLTELTRRYAHPFTSWRDFLHEMRLDWATQLLSIDGLSLERVAELAGYRSTVALHHAFSARGAPTPRTIARHLSERWGS